ncbi:alpha-N-arabinofuranosidase [Actinotalea sp. M2MS4P-6]|uniref:alpha-N-arabinofuranosidase n=1 Tax=Actinotalea sp. M2MS4P-6 TaxID=2983762 RepID=UPI0021E39EA2|nr:alpha-L-arabinofuranosidase C-terminal domain-containing protein [Actinotalea sp. M2MS4P-6]MCV2394424.1 alpha-N-arabinofuranosidase [Actinotalea sp. M2MS4P-6]
MTRRVEAVIDVDVPGATISRHLHGQFAEHLGTGVYGGLWVGTDSGVDHVDGFRAEAVAALRELGVPNVRWPGGCFADEYHWRDGVGPREQRPRMVNTHWGDVEETNHVGTAEFLRLCELLDAEPYICGNVGSGSVREMSEWVDYLTRDGRSPMADLRRAHGRDEPWRIRFWGLGNEPWGCGGQLRADAYADLALQYATYCRDHGDSRLYRIAAGADSEDYAWTEALMRAVAPTGTVGERPAFQGLSLHHYTLAGPWHAKGSATRFSVEDWWRTVAEARRVESIVRRHVAVMDRYDPERRIGLVLDEWGTWWDVEPGTNPGFLHQQGTMRDAVVAAVHLDVFHRTAERLVMANVAQAVNVLQAMLLVDLETGAVVRTPTFHVFEMARVHQDAASLAVHLRGDLIGSGGGVQIPVVSASASTRDGAVHVSLANLHPQERVEVVLDLRGGSPRTAAARVLASDDLADHNTAARPDLVRPRELAVLGAGGPLAVTLPPASVAVASVELG